MPTQPHPEPRFIVMNQRTGVNLGAGQPSLSCHLFGGKGFFRPTCKSAGTGVEEKYNLRADLASSGFPAAASEWS